MGDWEEAALVETDPIEPSSSVERWRRRSVTGSVLTGFALGLQEIFYPAQKEEIVAIIEAGDPPGDREFELDLAPDDPGHSTVTIRR